MIGCFMGGGCSEQHGVRMQGSRVVVEGIFSTSVRRVVRSVPFALATQLDLRMQTPLANGKHTPPTDSSTLLNARQKEHLDSALFHYLQKYYPHTAHHFQQECTSLHEDSAPSSISSRLEMKWSLVLKLQKQKLELQQQVKQLQTQIENYETGRIAHSQQDKAKLQRKANLVPKELLHVLHGHRMQVTALAFHPKFNMLASASEDCSIRFWDYESAQQEHLLKGHLNMVNDLHFSPQGDMLVSCSNDLSIRLWTQDSGWQLTRIMNGHDHIVSCVRFVGHDAKRVLSASRDHTLKLWEISSGFCLRTFRGHQDWVRALDVSPDASVAVSASDDKTLRTWNLQTGHCINVFRSHEHNIQFVHFSPSCVNRTMKEAHGASILPSSNNTTHKSDDEPAAQFFVSGSRDKTLKVWNTHTAQLIFTLKGHDNWIRDAYWHPNGTHLVSCSDDKSIRIWDIRTALPVRTLPQVHNHFVSQIKLCPKDDSLVATASVDNTIKIWRCT